MRSSMRSARSFLLGPLLWGVGFAVVTWAPSMAAYDVAARESLSPNDVKAFVYQWFAGFDHQAPLESFTRHLDPTGVEIRYPDFPINTTADFQRWYQGVIDNIAWNTHEVRDLQVVSQPQNAFAVTLDVCWRARTYKGESLSLLVNQQWQLVVRDDQQLRLHRLIATVKGTC